MVLEETTVSVVRKLVEKSGSRTSNSRLAHTSTSSTYKDKDKDKDKDKNKNKDKINDKVHDKDNGQSTRADIARVGMDLEASVAGNRWKNQGIILSKRNHQDQHQQIQVQV
jgi:hypothetical protein